MRRQWAVTLFGLMCSAAGWAQSIPVTPIPKATGRSNIEQRYVYAPPDKGEFDVPLLHGGAAANEVAIEEPIMCSPHARASVHVSYDKAKNEVVFEAEFHKALPYRMSYTRPDDPSTPYNQHLQSVQNGKWQLWFVGQLLSFDTTFYYDGTTLQLLGNAIQFPGGPPPGAIPVSIPTLHMLCSPMFEGRPNGDAKVKFVYRYDQLLDDLGNGGTWAAFLPYNLCKPDEYGIWYLNGGLPPSRAMSWDKVLDSIWQGYGMAFSSSLEPDPKPAFLASRDNLMIGWGGAYPQQIPDGMGADPVNGTLFNATSCGTHVAKKFPPAYFNVCGP